MDPPNPTVRESAVELGRFAGFQPSKLQLLPGLQKLWYAWTIFAPAMLALAGLQDIRHGRRVKRGKLIGSAGRRTTAVFHFFDQQFKLRLHARAK